MSKEVAKVTDSLIDSNVVNLCPNKFNDIVGHPIPDMVIARYVQKLHNRMELITFFDIHMRTRLNTLIVINRDRNSSTGLGEQTVKLKNTIAAKQGNSKRSRDD